MNIFYLDSDPALAASYQIDAHAKGGKMFVEACQMIANGFSLEQLNHPDCPRTQVGEPRKHSYLHHPCSKWAMESQANFLWLLNHASYLLDERQLRAGKRHFCEGFWKWAWQHRYSAVNVNGGGFSFPPQCMPEEYRQDNTIKAYREFYLKDKIPRLGANWTNRKPPEWYLTPTDVML